MSEQNENIKKGKSKNQPKIHRRKNQEIPKQFFCSVEACGKAYGSYAALYTHMKNKHKEIKPPNMPATTKPKNSHPGRPKVKKNQNQKIQQIEGQPNNEQILCKICQQQQCQCVESFDSEQKKKTIQIMSCQKFTSFTNQIGLLGYEEVNWVRRTQEDFVYKSPQTIVQQVKYFNEKNELDANPSQKLIDYLSFSSKYWDPQSIDELYNVIYAMVAFQNHQLCVKFVMESLYTKMQSCIKKNPNQFKRLQSIVRVI